MLTEQAPPSACEFQQRRDIMVVGCAKGRDIASAQFTDMGQSSAAPTEALAAKRAWRPCPFGNWWTRPGDGGT